MGSLQFGAQALVFGFVEGHVRVLQLGFFTGERGFKTVRKSNEEMMLIASRCSG